MIEGLFRELDRKISAEWNDLSRQIVESGENDNLTDEMKTESILRQLTYSSVSLVAVLLDSRQGKCYKNSIPKSVVGSYSATVDGIRPNPNTMYSTG